MKLGIIAAMATLAWAGAGNATSWGQPNAYSGPRSTCAQLQNALRREGHILITGNNNTYFRVVSGWDYCALPGEFIKDAWTKTRDNPSCRVGFKCRTDNG